MLDVLYFQFVLYYLLKFLTFSHRWISVGSDLKYDARRDLDDVGATCIQGSYISVHGNMKLIICNVY